MAVMVVVAYDVTDDVRRSRLAATLQTLGDRVQRSVFVIRAEGKDVDELLIRAQRLIDPDEDSIYVFRQCADCWETMACMGQASPPQAVYYWAVL